MKGVGLDMVSPATALQVNSADVDLNGGRFNLKNSMSECNEEL